MLRCWVKGLCCNTCVLAYEPAAIISLLRDLDEMARQEGGAVYMLNGNHESLNICGDFRSVLVACMLLVALCTAGCLVGS
jgi:hypothetical protein